MKKIFAAVLIGCSMSISAVNYCATGSWGYAGKSVTGGGDATPTLVSSVSQFAAAFSEKKPQNKVVIITQNLTFTKMITIQDASNITIMALPGVQLISEQQTKETSGILFIKRTSNLILRNLTFVGPGAYDVDGNDNLCFEKVTNAWVDHCDFQDGMDGNFDIKSTTDNITVSWCRFRYLKAPKAGGSGGSNDHRFSNLVGSSSSDKPTDGTYNITYAYCWWDEGCKQRMTRCRNAELHFLNCYWNSSVADYYVGPENAKCYFEGCTFAGRANSADKIWSPFSGSTNYCTFVNCSGNLPDNSSTPVAAPSYAYDQLSASGAKSYVTHNTCGAGATLKVTNVAEVSSTCDGGDDPTPPQGELSPVTENTWWNFSDDDFKDLGTITSNTIVRNLLIAANSASFVTVDRSSKTVDDIAFTSRLKLGGTGSEAARHLQFIVTGPCTITAYLISSSSSADRSLNIAIGTFDNVVGSMSAPGTTVAKQTYDYKGGAASIYVYSPDKGVNLYGIRLTYNGATDVEQVHADAHARKIIYNNNVYILHEGKTYTLTGTEVISR